MILSGSGIVIGTSGWSYNLWKGALIRKRSNAFNMVEINTSFYRRLPSRKTVVQWRQATGAELAFSVKACRYITHRKKLRDSEKAIATLLERTSMLWATTEVLFFFNDLPPLAL